MRKFANIRLSRRFVRLKTWRFRRRWRYRLAFLTVRPRRWFFWKCIAEGSFCNHRWGWRWLPRRREEWDCYHPGYDRKRTEWEMIEWPNIHWVFAYLTVFAFFRWLRWDAWRPLCRWEGPGGSRSSFPWYARLVMWIGETTAGQACHSSECWHCAAPNCDPCSLSEDTTGYTFILMETGSTATLDGTDHWFRGISICPRCGHREDYGDGSL